MSWAMEEAVTGFLAAGDSDNPSGGSEHSRIDGDVPAARVAALRQQRPRWDKSTGHGQSDQGAERPAARNAIELEASAEERTRRIERAFDVGERHCPRAGQKAREDQ